MRTRLGIGTALILLACVLAVVVQAVSGNWFPPPISMSQYGVGTNGWIFSLWVLCLSISPVVLQTAVPYKTRWGSWLLLAGMVGTAVMAVVRTDAGGEQASVNAKIHMVGSIIALFCIPLGVALFLWGSGRWWRWTGMILLTLIAAALLLLILAATGLDTAGRGPQGSWVWWQTVAAVFDHVIVACLAIVGWQSSRRLGSRTAAASSLNVH